MKRLTLISVSVLLFGFGVWAAVNLETAPPDPAKLLPDGALLYLQAKDFQNLLSDWNSSNEKRVWLKGDNYAAFSRSRLFDRLSQAQGEFSTAAIIPADDNLLSSIAGHQSALALYDIGNLEFVYVTQMDQARIEATPLWRVRDKFEQRTEGAAQFFVHQDTQSKRTAAFAARDGWFILATRADLVAGVLDRLQGMQGRSLPDEAWYADAIKQAKGPADDLRMVLNFEKILPSPYFRSYWLQRNVTEMKQYRAALCDLHRTRREYREDRVLLRKPGATAAAAGDVSGMLALAPNDAAFSSAVASPSPDRVLAEMRENVLDLKPNRAQMAWSAPPAQVQQNAGNASDLEERIDVAPVILSQTDPYQPLRVMITSAQPTALLEVYTTRTPEDQMFAAIDRALVIQSTTPWNATAVQNAIAAAIRPGLTASRLGVEWSEKTTAAGDYFALNGEVQIYLAVHDTGLLLATSESLLQRLLTKTPQTAPPAATSGVTYAAVVDDSPREQQNFRKIVDRLDSAAFGNHVSQESGSNGNGADGKIPPFFSGNIGSLSRTFADVARESIEEKDQGELVTQTVIYQWEQQ